MEFMQGILGQHAQLTIPKTLQVCQYIVGIDVKKVEFMDK
jgi:hypothetical protein